MSATQRALDTPELLENILWQLPNFDILFAQRVSRTWKDNIAASPKLQKALFFRPVDTTPLQYHEVFDATQEQWSLYWALPGSDDKPVQVYKNPLLALIFRLMQDSPHYQSFLKGSPVNPRYMMRLPPSWWRKEASWRRMLLTQPPFEGEIQMINLCPRLGTQKVIDKKLPIQTWRSCLAGLVVWSLEKEYRPRDQKGKLMMKAQRQVFASRKIAVIKGARSWKFLEDNVQLEGYVKALDDDADAMALSADLPAWHFDAPDFE